MSRKGRRRFMKRGWRLDYGLSATEVSISPNFSTFIPVWEISNLSDIFSKSLSGRTLSSGALEVKVGPAGVTSLGEAWDHERMLKKKESAFPAIRRGSMISTTSMRPFIGSRARFLRN